MLPKSSNLLDNIFSISVGLKNTLKFSCKDILIDFYVCNYYNKINHFRNIQA